MALVRFAVLVALVLLAPAAAAEEGRWVYEPDPNHAPAGAKPWDMRYLLGIDPNTVTWREMADYAEWVERNYQLFHQRNGIAFTAEFEDRETAWPTAFGDGGDAALWTGVYLATAVWRYQCTRRPDHLFAVTQAVRGLHILTHISGTPGVLCRCAFPVAEQDRFRYPDHWVWQHRHGEGSMYVSGTDVPDPFHPGTTYPQMVFHTDTSRDQLTGTLFGIAVLWRFLKVDERTPADPETRAEIARARTVAAQVQWALNEHLSMNPNRKHRWRIVDHTGRRGKEGAWKVENHLKVQFMNLTRQLLLETVPGDHGAYDKSYRKALDGTFSKMKEPLENVLGKFNKVEGYYAQNLRHLRMYAMLLFSPVERRRQKLKDYFRNVVWDATRHHQNTHFTFLYNAAMNRSDGRGPAIWQLKALARRPLRTWSSPLVGRDVKPDAIKRFLGAGKRHVLPVHLRSFEGYFVWQKEPWKLNEEFVTWPTMETPGLAFLCPYWLGRFMGYLPAE